MNERDKLAAYDRLAAENERLRAALADLRAEVEDMTRRCGWFGHGARARADAALAACEVRHG